MRTRTKWFLLGGLAATSLALVHCVGDDPSPPPGEGTDGGGDGDLLGDTVTPPTDSGNPTDAGADSATVCSAAANNVMCGAGVTPCIIQIAGGGQSYCARDTNCNVYCWGDNRDGQLATDPGTTPFSTKPLKVDLGGQLALGVDVGGPFPHGNLEEQVACARVVPAAGGSATVSCWGANKYFQLAYDGGPTGFSTTPVQIPSLIGIDSIQVGSIHACATTSSNLLDCWGYNAEGELGLVSTTTALAEPAKSNAVPAHAADGYVAVGFEHTCVINGSGHVLCTGDNTFAQLGNDSGIGDLPSTGAYVQIAGLQNIVELSANGNSTCALDATGIISCWGYNGDAQMGNGTVGGNYPVPATPIGLGAVSANGVQAGFGHYCANLPPVTFADGGTTANISCWGDNAGGQTGQLDGGTYAFVPTTVNGLPPGKIVKLAAASNSTCALNQNGTVWCWGENFVGQLGDRGDAGNDLEPRAPGQVTF